MRFYLGTHQPHWLALTSVPLFVSYVTLRGVRRLPRALGPWALDSGGFSEIAKHGRWTVPAREYADAVRRFRDEVGGLEWAAIQDWMCEPDMLKKTGLSVAEHQARTVASLLELRSIAPDVPWCPVVQGWTRGDYLDCVDAYDRAGVDLREEPVVGIGTVCRRQHTTLAEHTIRWLASDGLKLHGFGFKTQGLLHVGDALASADSLAWSFNARREQPLPGHHLPGDGRRKGHINCANCLEYALLWRDDLLTKIARASGRQLDLFAGAAA